MKSLGVPFLHSNKTITEYFNHLQSFQALNARKKYKISNVTGALLLELKLIIGGTGSDIIYLHHDESFQLQNCFGFLLLVPAGESKKNI